MRIPLPPALAILGWTRQSGDVALRTSLTGALWIQHSVLMSSINVHTRTPRAPEQNSNRRACARSSAGRRLIPAPDSSLTPKDSFYTKYWFF